MKLGRGRKDAKKCVYWGIWLVSITLINGQKRRHEGLGGGGLPTTVIAGTQIVVMRQSNGKI